MLGMEDITKICKLFNKLPGHFKDNYADKSGFVVKKEGTFKHTFIKDELRVDFIIWLSKDCAQLRQMLPLEGIEKTLEFARRYKKI